MKKMIDDSISFKSKRTKNVDRAVGKKEEMAPRKYLHFREILM